MNWKIVYTKQSQKDAKKIKKSGFKEKVLNLIEIIKKDQRTQPPPMKKLVGDLSGAYSRRINIKHRLVYQILDEERIIKVLSMWSHYE
ncbi:Txe/YoeB family addiction module toxin [bacterium]|nr:Txe/YoeB family addiction module toxin [bacterium]